MAGKRLGWLYTCATPYCGGVHGYFCVRCHHYTAGCDCRDSGDYSCACPDQKGLAGPGEREMVKAAISQGMSQEQAEHFFDQRHEENRR